MRPKNSCNGLKSRECYCVLNKLTDFAEVNHEQYVMPVTRS